MCYLKRAFVSCSVSFQTLLSLSKLCQLASNVGGVTGEAEEVEDDTTMTLEEELILYQEQLPEPVLTAHSLDPDSMRVLSPTELVHVSLHSHLPYMVLFLLS